MANRNIPERFQRTSNILNAGKHDSGIAQSPPPVPPKDEKYNQSQPYVSRLDPGPFSPISTEPLESSKMKKARSLDKPTSNTTQQQESQGSSSNPSNSRDRYIPPGQPGRDSDNNAAFQEAQHAAALEGFANLDLKDSKDTTVHEVWAPAVTHETITHPVHEIREERITREIHEDHVYHRILPITDVQVLPARHFVRTDSGLKEMKIEEKVLGRARKQAQRLVDKGFSRHDANDTFVPKQFTARKFEGTDGDYKESNTPDGYTQTERWWVHPPTLETGAMESGQTQPFYLNSPNPKDDGLRDQIS